MKLTASSHEPRFARLLEGSSRFVWDKVLLDGPDFVVAPTRGSIVPNWVMVIPKQHTLNFASQAMLMEVDPYFLASGVAKALGATSDWIWFEHGASHRESEVGCGVDHAHLHILLSPNFTFSEFADEVFASSDDVWQEKSPDHTYESLDGATSYYAFGNSQRGMSKVGVSLGRQFFRKAVAKIAKVPSEWDYNLFPHETNVAETVSTLTAPRKQAA